MPAAASALAARPVLLVFGSGVYALPAKEPSAPWVATSQATALVIAASTEAGRGETAASWATTNAVASVSVPSTPSIS